LKASRYDHSVNFGVEASRALRQAEVGATRTIKFRTTAPDPEHRSPLWARKTTPIGEFLRYTRLESLPQLFNVLRGEMSLIEADRHSPSFLE